MPKFIKTTAENTVADTEALCSWLDGAHKEWTTYIASLPSLSVITNNLASTTRQSLATRWNTIDELMDTLTSRQGELLNRVKSAPVDGALSDIELFVCESLVSGISGVETANNMLNHIVTGIEERLPDAIERLSDAEDNISTLYSDISGTCDRLRRFISTETMVGIFEFASLKERLERENSKVSRAKLKRYQKGPMWHKAERLVAGFQFQLRRLQQLSVSVGFKMARQSLITEYLAGGGDDDGDTSTSQFAMEYRQPSTRIGYKMARQRLITEYFLGGHKDGGSVSDSQDVMDEV